MGRMRTYLSATATPLALVAMMGVTGCGARDASTGDDVAHEEDDLFTSSSTSALQVVNQGEGTLYVIIYQNNSAPGFESIYPVAWKTLELETGQSGNVDWTNNYSFIASSTEIQAGALIEVNASENATEAGGSDVTYNGSLFSAVTAGTQTDLFTLESKADSAFTGGLALDGSPLYVTEVQREEAVEFDMSSPKLYIVASSSPVEQGTLLESAMLEQAQALSMPSNGSLTAIYEVEGTWVTEE